MQELTGWDQLRPESTFYFARKLQKLHLTHRPCLPFLNSHKLDFAYLSQKKGAEKEPLQMGKANFSPGRCKQNEPIFKPRAKSEKMAGSVQNMTKFFKEHDRNIKRIICRNWVNQGGLKMKMLEYERARKREELRTKLNKMSQPTSRRRQSDLFDLLTVRRA